MTQHRICPPPSAVCCVPVENHMLNCGQRVVIIMLSRRSVLSCRSAGQTTRSVFYCTGDMDTEWCGQVHSVLKWDICRAVYQLGPFAVVWARGSAIRGKSFMSIIVEDKTASWHRSHLGLGTWTAISSRKLRSYLIIGVCQWSPLCWPTMKPRIAYYYLMILYSCLLFCHMLSLWCEPFYILSIIIIIFCTTVWVP